MRVPQKHSVSVIRYAKLRYWHCTVVTERAREKVKQILRKKESSLGSTV